MKITLNISPCPNDTFMFDAMLNGRIDTGGLRFEVRFADIEELNAMAVAGVPDVTKISYAAFPAVADRYCVLDSGSALGRGNGPLVVSRGPVDLADPGLRIAIPGLLTTANALMTRLFPHLTRKSPELFSDISRLVAEGRYDAGVLIHEGRFTFADCGLTLAADLGAEWERAHGLPLPLGAIAASRRLVPEVRRAVDDALRRSVEFALADPAASRQFVRSHACEMDEVVMQRHIALFVNRHSVSLGPDGRRAAAILTGMAEEEIFG